MKGASIGDCPFCAIAMGHDASPEIVASERDWLAFFPIDPATPGHTLIIPREHLADLWEVEPPLHSTLMAAAIQLGRAVRDATDAQGMNLITSAGSAAEQTVYHLHLHLVPRWSHDGFGSIWPITGTTHTDARLDGVASRIRRLWEQASCPT